MQEDARRNIELKAALPDRAMAEVVCARLGAALQGDIHQVDTYFHVPKGRLKLREAEPGRDELVFYLRPDVPGPKGCDYLLEAVNRSMKRFLAEALGVLAVVEKTRTLYLWHNVRIHLDRVDGLGDFIEFEAVLSEKHDDADGHRKLAELSEAFAIAETDLRECSYLELALGRQRDNL